MMTNSQLTRRRRVQNEGETVAEPARIPDSVNSSSQIHHHNQRHHHHNFYHRPAAQFNQNEDRMSESSSPMEARSHSNPQDVTSNNRLAALERSWAAAVLSHRHQNGLAGNFLEEFSHLFEDDDISEDDLWLAASGFAGDWSAAFTDVDPTSPGLSKRLIKHLKKEIFVSKESQDNNSKTGSAEKESLEQEECSVCLEHFISGQQLICLPCKHRFHPQCLTPWLESHVQCPYCRAKISSEGSEAGSSHQGIINEDDMIAWMEALNSDLSTVPR